MTRDKVVEEVNNIFQDVFEDDELVINNLTCADDIEDWDSLEQINLILEMEKRFEVKFKINEVSQLENVGEMIDLIIDKLENI